MCKKAMHNRHKLNWISLVAVGICLAVGCRNSESSDERRHVDTTGPESAAQTESNRPFNIVLEQTFAWTGDEDEAILSSILEVVTDDEKNVYINDPVANQVVSYDSTGVYRWAISERGDGPGELNRVLGIRWDGDQLLYVFNHSGYKIDRFNHFGEFVDSYSLSEIGLPSVSPVGFIDPQTLVAVDRLKSNTGVSVSILTVDDGLSLRNTFEVDRLVDSEVPENAQIMPYVGLLCNNIAIGHVSKYKIEIRNTLGDEIDVLERDEIQFVGPGFFERDGVVTTMSYNSLNYMLNIDSSHVLVGARWATNVRDPDDFTRMIMERSAPKIAWSRAIDIYDTNFQLVYSWIVEEGGPGDIGSIVHIDHDGNIYARMNSEAPQLGRYRISFPYQP